MRAIQRRNTTTTSWRRSRQFLGFGALMRSSWSYCHAICFGVLVKRLSLSLALALIVCICVIGIIDAWVRFRDAVQGWDFCGIRSRESLETSIIFFIVLEWKTSSLRYFMFLISSSSSLPLFAHQWGTYSSFSIKALYDYSVDAGGVC